MKSEIKNIRLKFNCEANWDDMTDADGGRHCNSCSKTVYDFTDAKPYEFLQILSANSNNICGRFRADQMVPQPIVVPVWKKWVSAALVLIGVNVLNHPANAQKGKIKIVEQHLTKIPDDIFVGDVKAIPYDKMPAFPSGDNAMFAFIKKNLHFGEGMKTGKVFVSFGIAADGSLINYKILRGLSKANDDAVIAMLKKSPKWSPAILKGKAVGYPQYVIPVNFVQ